MVLLLCGFAVSVALRLSGFAALRFCGFAASRAESLRLSVKQAIFLAATPPRRSLSFSK